MSDHDRAGAGITAPAAKTATVDVTDSPCTCPLCSSPFSTGVHRGPAIVANPPVGETVDLAALQERILRAGRAS